MLLADGQHWPEETGTASRCEKQAQATETQVLGKLFLRARPRKLGGNAARGTIPNKPSARSSLAAQGSLAALGAAIKIWTAERSDCGMALRPPGGI